MKIGIVSGYFNPLHAGHIEYFNAAKEKCDKLIAIINSDHQRQLKGSKEFMDEYHRLFIVKNLKAIDNAFISIDKDKTQCETLRHLRVICQGDDLLFFNSGDRNSDKVVPETETCRELGIQTVILDLPKKFSSSELLQKL